MRADARERRDRLLIAAAELFAEAGHDVALDAIAAKAEVGIATLYRNFPDRQSLIEAVSVATQTRAAELQKDALERWDTHPRAVWREYAHALVELRVGALVPVLAPTSLAELSPEVWQQTLRNHDRATTLMTRAQNAGLVPAEIGALGFIIGLATVARPQVQAVEELKPGFRTQLVDIYLDGLEAQA